MNARLLVSLGLISTFAHSQAPEVADFVPYTKESRMKIMGQLVEGVKADYSSVELKPKSAGVDFKAEYEGAIAREAAVEDTNDPVAQADINLRFLDRVQLFIAKFKDSHFSVRPINPLQPVTLGIYFKKIRGHYKVSGVSQKIMAYNDMLKSGANEFSTIDIGDELLGFNRCEGGTKAYGCPPEQEVAKLLPYLPASSQPTALLDAVYSLTERNFALPEAAYAELTLFHKADNTTRTFKMPWYLSGKTAREDELLVLEKRRMNRQLPFLLDWDQNTRKFSPSGLETKQYTAQDSFASSLISDFRYNQAEKPTSPAMRLGVGIRKGFPFALIQLFTMVHSDIFQAMPSQGTTATRLEYFAHLTQFVASIKALEIPVIVDLRNNYGGDTDTAPRVLSLLAPAGAAYNSYTMAFRVNKYTRELFPSLFGSQNSFPQLSTEMDAESFSALVQNAKRKGQTITDAISAGIIRPDQNIKGFEEKIAVLVGPNCYSTCDILAQLFKTSKRARLIGEPSAGTGAGFAKNGVLNTDWKDTEHVLTGEIPNFLFGRPVADDTKTVFENQAEALNDENHPEPVDAEYTMSEDDLLHQDVDALDFVIDDLKKH